MNPHLLRLAAALVATGYTVTLRGEPGTGPVLAAVRERRETVWCEAHGDDAHFERDDCRYPHLTDEWTRERLNRADGRQPR